MIRVRNTWIAAHEIVYKGNENQKYFLRSLWLGGPYMRVLVAGQSGLDKMHFLNDLQLLCNDKARDSCDEGVALDEGTLRKAHIHAVLDVEKEFQQRETVSNYLDINESQFIDGKNQILRELDQQYGPDKNLIIATHLTYFRKKSIFHRVGWDSLRMLGPDMIITLIDDVHSVYSRIQGRRDPDDYVRSVTMKDLMSWREAEIMMAQTIADNLYTGRKIPHYLVALNHKVQVVYQLIFEQGKKRVYASYPMTTAKDDRDLIRAIGAFVEELKKYFIVFDPGTIGEKTLHDSTVNHLRGPLPSLSPFISVNGKEYRLEELLPILPDIGGQIVTRDERLIRQSNAIIAYRPALSEGIRYELDYAAQIGRYSVAFHPKDDGESPFAQRAQVSCADYQHFMRTVREFANS